MERKRRLAAEKRRVSKSIFDDESREKFETETNERCSVRKVSESSRSTSCEYVSRGVQNLSESSSDDEDDDCRTLPPPVEPTRHVSTDDSDASGEGQVSEYFDFSEIINTQQQIKDLEANKTEGQEKTARGSVAVEKNSFCISETKIDRRKKNLKRKNDKQNDRKDDQTDVRLLLAMGESKVDCDEESENDEPVREDVEREIQVRIDMPSLSGKKTKKKFDIEAALKRRLNAVKRENQVYLHKVHILCLLAHWNQVDESLTSETLLASALSIVPSDKFYPPKLATLEYLEKLVSWFYKKIKVIDEPAKNASLVDSLVAQFSEGKAHSLPCKVMLFICVVRVLGLKCRLLVNLQPVPMRPAKEDLLPINTASREPDSQSEESSEDDFTEVVDKPKKSKQESGKKKTDSEYFNKGKSSKSDKSTKKEVKKKGNVLRTPEKSTAKSVKSKTPSSTVKAGSSRSKQNVKSASLDRRVLSSDSDDLIVMKKKKKVGTDVWAEVFLESEEKWISVDLSRGRIHCIDQIQSLCSKPVLYVIGWNGDGTFKDLTKRYAPQWLTTTRKLRVESAWWDCTVAPWKPRSTAREREEDYELDKILEDKPLPASIAEYKNHPLYVLKRHLLKFEAIYPADAPPLGYVKNEPVYSRLCVAELHSRETWLRQAKSVRVNEKAYKIVKARPKYDKLTGTVVSDLPLEIFGHWQVEDYVPPVAVNGTVPRNDWGNVELYKPSMLPVGTVHLQIPGLLRVARKLKIDCAPALVGWEYNQGCSFPVLDGFVVCEEFKDVLLDQWNKQIDESAKREREKVEQRVYGNWKRLIKGLIIRERLEKKYNFGSLLDEPGRSKKPAKRKSKK